MTKCCTALSTMLVVFLATAAHAQDVRWVKNPDPTKPMTCAAVCKTASLLNVEGGLIGSNNDRYSVCVQDMDGLRVGSEAPGAFSGKCDVGHDGKAKAAPVYACLCATTVIQADK